MASSANYRMTSRKRRHFRVRKRVSGTETRPRVAVFRSTNHIVAQIIDDISGKTLVAASTHEADLRDGPTGNIAAATTVGTRLGERAKAAGITTVVFDRGGFAYHGRVQALADAARNAGLEF